MTDVHANTSPVVSEAEPQPADDSTLDLDGARTALRDLRRSEAAMRVRLREAESKLAGAKTPEEFEAIKTELAKANADETRALTVENVALKFSLPEDLAAALKGETREELEAHAKVLAKYAPSGGLLDDELDRYDPAERAKLYRHGSVHSSIAL